jgi:hypothetical protein
MLSGNIEHQHLDKRLAIKCVITNTYSWPGNKAESYLVYSQWLRRGRADRTQTGHFGECHDVYIFVRLYRPLESLSETWRRKMACMTTSGDGELGHDREDMWSDQANKKNNT